MNRYLQLGNLMFWFALELSRPSVAFSLAERLSSATALGLLLSVQSLLPLILAIPIGMAGDRLGARLMLPVGAALMLCSGAAYWMAGQMKLADDGYVALMLTAQLLNGIAWLLVWISTQALVSSAGSPGESDDAVRNRVQKLALTASLGALAGPAVSGWLYPVGGGTMVWGVFGAAALVLLLLALKSSQLALAAQDGLGAAKADGAKPRPSCAALQPVQHAARHTAHPAGSRKAAGRGKPAIRPLYVFVLLASLVLFFGSEFRATFMPAYLTRNGHDTGMIGLALTIGAVGVGAVRLLISGNWLRMKERTAVGLSFMMTIAGIALLPLLESGGLPAIALVSLLLAVAVGIGEPVLIFAVIRSIAPARRGLALAGRLTANRLAMLLAPLCAAMAIQIAGPVKGLLLIGMLLAFAGGWAARLFWKYGS